MNSEQKMEHLVKLIFSEYSFNKFVIGSIKCRWANRICVRLKLVLGAPT